MAIDARISDIEEEDITVLLKDFSQLKSALNQSTFQLLTRNLEQALREKD